ncbi:MAG: hypothetical protein MJY49_00020 [Bacteroidales bacterium]|nr:hypothetical protein [Bacteroidales bacterium]
MMDRIRLKELFDYIEFDDMVPHLKELTRRQNLVFGEELITEIIYYSKFGLSVPLPHLNELKRLKGPRPLEHYRMAYDKIKGMDVNPYYKININGEGTEYKITISNVEVGQCTEWHSPLLVIDDSVTVPDIEITAQCLFSMAPYVNGLENGPEER